MVWQEDPGWWRLACMCRDTGARQGGQTEERGLSLRALFEGRREACARCVLVAPPPSILAPPGFRSLSRQTYRSPWVVPMHLAGSGCRRNSGRVVASVFFFFLSFSFINAVSHWRPLTHTGPLGRFLSLQLLQEAVNKNIEKTDYPPEFQELEKVGRGDGARAAAIGSSPSVYVCVCE
jgi:hypothetical protein